MSLLYTVLAGLAILPLVIYIRFPYFVQDIIYLVKGIRLALRIRKFKSSVPCYTIIDCFLDAVRKHPKKKFIIFENQSYSYEYADKMSNKVVNTLLDHTSLRPGDTAALFLGNAPFFVWTWLALAKLGCPASLLNYNIRSKSLLHCFSCCGAKILIADEDVREAVEEVLPALQQQQVGVYLLGDSCETDCITCLGVKINTAADEQPPVSLHSTVTIKSPALYIYTSGTTGLPKAALISHEKVWLASFLQSMSGVCSDDILYICLPLYHSAGFLMGLTGAIERGITVVLRKKFSASQFWNDCRKHNVTVIQYIGETMRYLCNTPKRENDRVHNVRIAIGNGIRADTWVEFLQRFGCVRICECYGATEGNVGFVNYTGKIGALGRMNIFAKKASHFALIKYDTEKDEPVRDSRGFCMEVPTGETGLLVAKITKVAPFSGYANNQQQTAKKKLSNVFQEGDVYFNSGDLLRVDKEGFVYFQDRTGDTFRWKGENVATTEVTDILIMVDFIEEANVYGVKVTEKPTTQTPDHFVRLSHAEEEVLSRYFRDIIGSLDWEVEARACPPHVTLLWQTPVQPNDCPQDGPTLVLEGFDTSIRGERKTTLGPGLVQLLQPLRGGMRFRGGGSQLLSVFVVNLPTFVSTLDKSELKSALKMILASAFFRFSLTA